jgi:DNA modification methylase
MIEFSAALVFGSWKAVRPQGTRAVLIWDKGPALGMGALDLPWKPSHEEIYVLGRGFVGARDEGAVICCSPVQSMAKNGRVHPNEKPVQLITRLLKKCPSGTILDPFMGFGIEIEERYFEIACERISRAERQPDMFVQRPVQEGMAL